MCESRSLVGEDAGTGIETTSAWVRAPSKIALSCTPHHRREKPSISLALVLLIVAAALASCGRNHSTSRRRNAATPSYLKQMRRLRTHRLLSPDGRRFGPRTERRTLMAFVLRGCTLVHPFVRARPFFRAEGIEGKLKLEAIHRGVRNAVLNASSALTVRKMLRNARALASLRGLRSRFSPSPSPQSSGKVRALRNRRRGRLLFPRDPDRDFVRRLGVRLALLAASVALIWTVVKPPLPGAPLAVFAVAGLLQLLLVAFIRRLLRDSCGRSARSRVSPTAASARPTTARSRSAKRATVSRT